jgi:hypothetical protein
LVKFQSILICSTATAARTPSITKATSTDFSLACDTTPKYGMTLWTSGGALELTKCQHHLMQWNCMMAGSPMVETGTNPNHSIELTSPVGDKLMINQLGCGTSYKTLGAFVKPLQHQQPQYRALLTKARAPSHQTSGHELLQSTTSACSFAALGILSQSVTFQKASFKPFKNP